MGVQSINETLNQWKLNKFNSMNNDMGKTVQKSEKALRTERIAKRLVEKFDAPNSYNFFLKCAWRLPEQFIWSAYEAANQPTVKSPVRYFVAVCHKEIQ